MDKKKTFSLLVHVVMMYIGDDWRALVYQVDGHRTLPRQAAYLVEYLHRVPMHPSDL